MGLKKTIKKEVKAPAVCITFKKQRFLKKRMPSQATVSSCCQKTMGLLSKLGLIKNCKSMQTLENVLMSVEETPSLYDDIDEKEYKGPVAAYMFFIAHKNAKILAFLAKNRCLVDVTAKALACRVAKKHANFLKMECLLLSPKANALEIIERWCQHLLDSLHGGALWVTARPLYFKSKIAPLLVFKDNRVALLANAAKKAKTVESLKQLIAQAAVLRCQ